MKTDDQECAAVAERAAEWLVRLTDATADEKREFMDWLRQSPLHVREFMLVARCKDLLERHLPFANADANVDANEVLLQEPRSVVRLD
jgi:ferric-dicitrate binding protein FerR (iron transport regulator)